MPLLLAPVVIFTPSIFVIRVYLWALSGIFLYLAFRPWVTLFQRIGNRYVYVPVVAAMLFSTLWITVLYGTMAYPNLWLTFMLVSGAGYAYRVATDPTLTRRPIAGAVAALGAASLLRPTDTLAVAVPLFVAPLLVRGWRRRETLASIGAGLAVGWGAWIAEAYARFDGPLQRLRDGAEGNRAGLVFTLPEHFAALDGPALLCIPHKVCEGVEPGATVWWFVTPVLAAIGLVAVARHNGWFRIGAVLVASAVAVAAPYMFLIDYAAPRFLLPSYGLLSLPVAAGLLWLFGWHTRWLRFVSVAAVSSALLAHVLVQQAVFADANNRLLTTLRSGSIQAEFLREDVGVEPPCLFWGEGAIQQGYLLRCESRWVKGQAPRAEDPYLAEALARGDSVAVRLAAGTEIPAFMANWERIQLPGTDAYVVYVPSLGR